MKPIIFQALLFSVVTSSLGLDMNYCPYSQDELRVIALTREATNSVGDTLTVTVTPIGSETNELQVLLGGTNVASFPVNKWMKNTATIIADLDNNGLEDVAKEVYYGTQGLLLGCDLMILSQYAPGRFSQLIVPAERFNRDDVFDFDMDGTNEIVTCVLVGQHESHNYWVYRCWHLSGSQLISADTQYGFPRAIWFTHKPNTRIVDQDLLRKLMDLYPSVVLEGIELSAGQLMATVATEP